LFSFCLLSLLYLQGCDRTRTAPPPTIDLPQDEVTLLLQEAQSAASPAAEAARIKAVEQLFERQRYAEAQNWLDTPKLQKPAIHALPTDLQYRIVAMAVRLALQNQNSQLAIELLTTDRLGLPGLLPLLSPEQAGTLSLLRATAWEQAGENWLATQERVFLAGLLTGDAQTANRNQTWRNLQSLPDTLIESLRQTVPAGDLQGWLELAWIDRDIQSDLDTRITLLQEWQMAYPAHPALQQLPDDIHQLLVLASERPARIAVLLPQSGQLANAAEAITEGFLAAHYLTPQTTANPAPEIRFYDASQPDQLMAQYEQAVREGAQFIVGPLQKEQVTILQQAVTAVTVPTLALNYGEGETSNPLLYQFGLSPEQEIQAVIERARRLGYQSAGVFYPNTPWGLRMAEAFQQSLARQPELHTLIAAEAFDAEEGYDQAIKKLLLVDQSEARARELKRITGQPLEFEARRRQDMDFLFLAATPPQARQIKPLLDFHFASDLPVLSTSHIFAGAIKPDLDRDMNGIEFCDLPWLSQAPHKVKTGFMAAWPKADPRLGRLHALGADAYHLVTRMHLISTIPGAMLRGVTGTLELGNHGQIVRELPWFRIEQGAPHALPALPAEPNPTIAESARETHEPGTQTNPTPTTW
jgi:outer membrane PBP1 activator LpoA protein